MLLRVPTASATELADGLGMSMIDIRACLRGLETKGLATRVPGARHRFQAAPPDQAFGSLIRQRHRELRAIRSEVGTLTDEYSGGGRRDVAESVELVFGESSIQGRCKQLGVDATSEVCALVTGGVPAFTPPGPETLRPGVRSRVVYPRWMLAHADRRHYLAEAIRGGQHARVISRPPVSLLLVDRTVALVPLLGDRDRLTGGHRGDDVGDGVGNGIGSGNDISNGIGMVDPDGLEHCAILVHPGGLRDALLGLFESTWAVAAPLLATDTGDVHEDPTVTTPSTDDLRLLGFMLDGLTDQAIAGKMGVGTRTVQRRVSDLIELVGVRTRLQLIWQATQRGWI